MGRRRHKAHRHPETGALVAKVEFYLYLDLEALVENLIGIAEQDGALPDGDRSDVEWAIAYYVVHRGLNNHYKADPEARAAHGPAAEKLVRDFFPELLEGPDVSGYLRPVEPPAGSLGPAFRLACPVCGRSGVTTGGPDDGGDSIAVPMEGDCGHRWRLTFCTAEGQTTMAVAPDPRGHRNGE